MLLAAGGVYGMAIPALACTLAVSAKFGAGEQDRARDRCGRLSALIACRVVLPGLNPIVEMENGHAVPGRATHPHRPQVG
jgi:hypothetical protein